MLFRIERTQVYLLASMHLLPQEWQDLSQPIWDAYHGSQLFLFEDNVLTPRFPFPPLKNNLDEFTPWAQALIRTSEIANEMGYLMEYGIEAQLLKKASRDGHQIEYLDSENACNAFIHAPLREQEMMRDMVMHQPHEIQKFLQGIYFMWQEWNVAALTELLESQFLLYPETYYRLITLRNDAWMPKIVSTLALQMPTLITVGALHFIGPTGIFAQLEDRGVNLLRV